jgi:hypothetical protein
MLNPRQRALLEAKVPARPRLWAALSRALRHTPIARTRWRNFERSHPEGFRQVLDVVLAQHSRVAEVALLDAMVGADIGM